MHPLFWVEQSTNYYSENESNLPVAKKWAPSKDPVVENAQHEPHYPWSLTAVIAPFVLQSTVVAASDSSKVTGLYEVFGYKFK